jgi:hypothetical protein
LAGSALGLLKFARLFALQPGEGLPKVVAELVTGMPHHREMLAVVLLLPPFDQHVVSGLVGAERQQGRGHLVPDQQMGLADDHLVRSAGPLLVGALGPQAPQRKFVVVEGWDVPGANRVELPGRRVSTNLRWAMCSAWKMA